jgi:hypothetical protein
LQLSAPVFVDLGPAEERDAVSLVADLLLEAAIAATTVPPSAGPALIGEPQSEDIE